MKVGLKENCPVDEVRVIRCLIVNKDQEDFDKKVHFVDQNYKIRLFSRKFNKLWDGFDPVAKVAKDYRALVASVKYRNPYWAVALNPHSYFALFTAPHEGDASFKEIKLVTPGEEDVFHSIKRSRPYKSGDLWFLPVFYNTSTKYFAHSIWESGNVYHEEMNINFYSNETHHPDIKIADKDKYHEIVPKRYDYLIPAEYSWVTKQYAYGFALFSDGRGENWAANDLIHMNRTATSILTLSEILPHSNITKIRRFKEIKALFYNRNYKIPYAKRFSIMDQDWDVYNLFMHNDGGGWKPLNCSKSNSTSKIMIDSIKYRYKHKNARAVWSDSPETYLVSQTTGSVVIRGVDVEKRDLSVIALSYGKMYSVTHDSVEGYQDYFTSYHHVFSVSTTGIKLYQFERKDNPTELVCWAGKTIDASWGKFNSHWDLKTQIPHEKLPTYIIFDFINVHAAVFRHDGSYTLRKDKDMIPFVSYLGQNVQWRRPRIYSSSLPRAKSACELEPFDSHFINSSLLLAFILSIVNFNWANRD